MKFKIGFTDKDHPYSYGYIEDIIEAENLKDAQDYCDSISSRREYWSVREILSEGCDI